MTIAEAFVSVGLASSKGEARRLAAQGGLSVDYERVALDDVDGPIASFGSPCLLRVGKHRWASWGDSEAAEN